MRLTEEQLKQILSQEGYSEVTYPQPEEHIGKLPAKRHKYGARKVEVDGITFDSAAEARRWTYLRTLEQANEIYGLQRQPSFVLQESFTYNGKRYREIRYRADFSYQTKDGQVVVEDVKGVQTPSFALKWKMLLYQAYRQKSSIKFVIVKGDER